MSRTDDARIEQSLKINGLKTTDSDIMAEKFNSYFTGIVKNLSE